MTTKSKEQLLREIRSFSNRLNGAVKPAPVAAPVVERWRDGTPKDRVIALREKVARLEEAVDVERLEVDFEWAAKVQTQFGELITARSALDTEVRERETAEIARSKREAALTYHAETRAAADAATEAQRSAAESKREAEVNLYYATGGASPMPH